MLAAANLTFHNVIKTTIYLTDMADFAVVNPLYAQAFSVTKPARSTVAVAALPLGAAIEIEVVALLP